MFKLLLKIIFGIIQIPLTIVYFALNIIGGILAGAGWIVGVIVFIITGICWLFGQFEVWYQPVIGIVIACLITFMPAVITELGGTAILKIKGLFHAMN